MSEFHCHYKIPFDLGDQTTEIYFLTVGDESPRSQSLNDDILVRAFLLSCRLPIPPCPDMEGGGGHGSTARERWRQDSLKSLLIRMLILSDEGSTQDHT